MRMSWDQAPNKQQPSSQYSVDLSREPKLCIPFVHSRCLWKCYEEPTRSYIHGPRRSTHVRSNQGNFKRIAPNLSLAPIFRLEQGKSLQGIHTERTSQGVNCSRHHWGEALRQSWPENSRARPLAVKEIAITVIPMLTRLLLQLRLHLMLLVPGMMLMLMHCFCCWSCGFSCLLC